MSIILFWTNKKLVVVSQNGQKKIRRNGGPYNVVGHENVATVS